MIKVGNEFSKIANEDGDTSVEVTEGDDFKVTTSGVNRITINSNGTGNCCLITANGGGVVSDAAYDSTWNGVTTIAPSKNAIWDWTKPYDIEVTAVPSSFGNHDDIDLAFGGDITKLQFPVKHKITGATTLGQPASGYLYRPEAYPHYTFMYNSSGWNQSTSADDGRTAACAYKTSVHQVGLGDAVCYNGSVYITGLKTGSTSFLANSAGVLFNGDVFGGADGVHLNAVEVNAEDNGYDVATNMMVVNLYRTNDTGAKDVWWNAVRIQSKGAKAIESAFHLNGKALWGMDFTLATITNSAIALKSGQKIEFNSTAGTYNAISDGGKYISYNGTNIHINDNTTIEGALILDEISAPSALAGYGKVYVKSSDNLLYFKDDSGTEYDLTTGGGVSNHSSLTELDYASAGHTGFSPDTHTHDKIIEGNTSVECVDAGDGYITFVEDGAEISRITGSALDMKTHKITNVVDPTANQEAATKKYVDDNAGSCSDAAYDSTWDGVTGIAPSKNAIWDWTKPYDVSITAAPTSHGSDDSIDTAFTGDLDKLQFPVKHRITGATTLTQPTTGYYYQNEAFPHFTYVHNESGWNQSVSADSGRTGCCSYRTLMLHQGLGDCACYNGGVYVMGLKPGATSWLANAAGVIVNGDVTAGANGVHLNAMELNALGGTYDCAANSAVFNMYRNVDTAAKGEWWNAVRVQSRGTKAIESVLHLNGKALWGVDFTLATFTNSAMALKVNQKIEFNASAGTHNASADGGKYIKYDGTYIYLNGSSKVNGNLTVVNTLSCDHMASTTLAAATHSFSSGNLAYSGGYIYSATHMRTGGQMRCAQFRIDQTAQAGILTGTHYISIEVNGVAYKVLLSNA